MLLEAISGLRHSLDPVSPENAGTLPSSIYDSCIHISTSQKYCEIWLRETQCHLKSATGEVSWFENTLAVMQHLTHNHMKALAICLEAFLAK